MGNYFSLGFNSLQYLNLSIDQLVINPSNDRHGPTGSEEAAILWLFTNKPKEMRKLAAKISNAGRIFDSPLVVSDEGRYIVRDGNRRITCLKLIHHPDKAPLAHQAFFKNLHIDCADRLPKSLFCQVEDQLDIVEDIIETRHNGVQDGEGQLPWGTREKAIHANRVSGKSDYEWSQRIEDFLITQGHHDEAMTINRSTLDRLLAAKKSRERFGFSEAGSGKLYSTQSDESTLELLLRLVGDMQSKRLTLSNLLKAENREAYIDRLSADGLLPNTSTRRHEPKSKSRIKKPSLVRKAKPTKRSTLIPRDVNYAFSWSVGQNKIQLAWDQLQFHLDLERHKLSVAVVFRTLIELSCQNFQNKKGIQSKEKLVSDLRQMNLFLLNANEIEKESHRDALRILDGNTSPTSIESLQRALHSKSHLPSIDDLTTIWDCLEPLIVAALKSCQKTDDKH